MAQALGRVVDTSALDACAEPRGRHAIEIPAEWKGAEILVAVPPRVVCARCDGGGCDGCRRRGGHRIEGDEHTRAVRVKLPRVMDGPVVLRLVRPFGAAEGAITQLHLETRIGPAASRGVELCALGFGSKDPADDSRLQMFKKAKRALKPSRDRSPVDAQSRPVAWVVLGLFAVGILVAVASMR